MRIFFLLFLLPGLAAGAVFPGAEWEVDAKFAEGRAPAKKALEDYAFPASAAKDRIVTEALLIIKGGKIVYERYAEGFRADMRHPGWSMSKSALGMLVGIAVADGKLALTDSICKYVRVPNEKTYCPIQAQHLLHHSSGLAWSEAYEDSDEPKDSAVLSMLYGEGIENMEKFVLEKHAAKFAPGTRWNYSSGDTNLLATILKNAVKDPDWATYPFRKIFDRIGAKTFLWETDARGVFVASSFLHGSARDYARLGLLQLRGGEWSGIQILPRAYTEYSVKPAPAFSITKPTPNSAKPEEVEIYGAHFWLNQPNPKFGLGQPWPSNPPDVYAMLGHWGQKVFLVPGEDLVIVRMGNDRGEKISSDQLLLLAREFAK